MRQKNNIIKITENGIKITQKKSEENGINAMIEKAEDKTREVVERFFSDEVMAGYYNKAKRVKERNDRKKRVEDYTEEISAILKEEEVSLDDEEGVEERIILFLKKKRATGIKEAINNFRKSTQEEQQKEDEQDGVEKKIDKKPVEELRDKDFEGGVLYEGGKEGKKKFLKVVIDKRVSSDDNIFVNILTDGGWKFKFEDKRSFSIKEAKELLEKMGYERSEEGDRGKNSEREEIGDKQEVKKLLTAEEFFSEYDYHRMEEAGEYVLREDKSKRLEIRWYYPTTKEVRVLLYQDRGMEENESEKQKDGTLIKTYSMPSRGESNKDEFLKDERIPLSKFEELIKEYDYVFGSEGNVEDGIESVMKAGADDDSLGEEDLPMEIKTHKEESNKKEGAESKEQPVEINKRNLNEEIKTKKQFEKEFYPVGTTIENQYKTSFIKFFDTKINNEGVLEIKINKGKRKNGKNKYNTKTLWLTVDEFNNFYDKDSIVWEVKGSNKRQMIETNDENLNEEDKTGKQKDEKEEMTDFSEEEKGYIDDFTEYVKSYLEELEEYLKVLEKKKYSDNTIKGIRDDETRHLLKEDLKITIANYGVFSNGRVVDVIEFIKKELK